MRTRIRDLRERKGLTLQELAAKIDMNFQSLSRVELGTQDPSAIHIVKLADFFGTTVDFLLHHESQTPPQNDKIIYKERDINYQSIIDSISKLSKDDLLKLFGAVDGELRRRSEQLQNGTTKQETTNNISGIKKEVNERNADIRRRE